MLTKEKVNFISEELNKLYPKTVLGLSDPTHGNSTVLGAIALGARVFEKHFTDNNKREGPDHKFAMNPNSWKTMVSSANEVYSALGDGKKIIEENEKETAIVQRRGLRFTRNLKSGHIIKKDDLIPLRPLNNDGLEPYKIKLVLGKKINKNVATDDYVRIEDIVN